MKITMKLYESAKPSNNIEETNRSEIVGKKRKEKKKGKTSWRRFVRSWKSCASAFPSSAIEIEVIDYLPAFTPWPVPHSILI